MTHSELDDLVASGGLRDIVDESVSHYELVKDGEGELHLEIKKAGRFSLADLRRHFGPAYSMHGKSRPMTDFDNAAIDVLYPFAMVLACLDGNAFTNRENPELDLVRQYVPDAFQTLQGNGCASMDEHGVVSILR